MAKNTLAAASVAVVGIRTLRDLATVGSGSDTEPRSGVCPGRAIGIGPATGAMKRYPRRGTVSTYLG